MIWGLLQHRRRYYTAEGMYRICDKVGVQPGYVNHAEQRLCLGMDRDLAWQHIVFVMWRPHWDCSIGRDET